MQLESANVMLIDDNPEDVGLIRRILTDIPDKDFRLECFENLRKAIESLGSFEADIILLNLELPDSTGTETLRKLSGHAPDTPIVIMAGLHDEFETIKKLLGEGAQDYLVKTQVDPEILIRAMTYAIDRKKSEQNLKQALQVKSEFLSKVSHELRTPLTAIKEGIDIVLDGAAGQINPEQQQYLRIARRNVDRLSGLIDDVLDFRRLDSDKFRLNIRRSNINHIIQEIFETMAPLARDKNLKMIVVSDDSIPSFDFDPDAIARVITNLINNAIKFTDTGSITIELQTGNNCVTLSVTDTGPGIIALDIPRLFNEFEQLSTGSERKTGGSGMGLVIAKKIIKKHNGKIWAESNSPTGTRFSFVLPLVERRKR